LIKHDCKYIEKLKYSQKIDEPKETINEFSHSCTGLNPMILDIQFIGQNGCEDIILDGLELEVKFCPFCGMKSETFKGVKFEKR